jgi:putative CocE/NonD family hydrolase
MDAACRSGVGVGVGVNKMNLHNQVLNLFFVICWSFNAASFQSIYYGGPLFTAADPVIGSALMAILCAVLCLTKIAPTKIAPTKIATMVHRTFCVLGAALLLYVSWVHFLNHSFYTSHYAYHNTHWRYALMINMFGAVALLANAVQGMPMKRVVLLVTATMVIVLVLFSAAVMKIHTLQQQDATSGSETTAAAPGQTGFCDDAPFFATPATPSEATAAALPVTPAEIFQHTSHYLTMSDGVKLATDVYLPHDYDSSKGEGLPTFLHLTRYHRAEKRSLWTKFIVLFGHAPNPEASFPMRSLHYLKIFVAGGGSGSGYAFVSVDVRGTGASFGTRPLDLIDREILDFAEVAQWTRGKSFCNGRIGTGGISYDGITGALMAAQGGIDAAALLFAPGDVYEDISFVGGIPTIGFIDWYGMFTTASENNVPVNDVDNELPAAFKVVSNWGFKGVAPVEGAESQLDTAVAEHKDNFDMQTKARDPSVKTKDSTLVTTSDGKQFSARTMGITPETYQGLVDHNVAVYSVAGYYDSGSVRSSARLHNYMLRNGGNSKLTIGPWTHGCRACWTPTKGAEATKSAYPLFDDVKRFMDCQLKDECDSSPSSLAENKLGVRDEPKLHYYLSGKDEWQTGVDEWPPIGLREQVFAVSEMEISKNDAIIDVDDANGHITYQANFDTTTGLVSRWNLVHHLMKKAVTYPDRLEQSRGSLVFEAKVNQSMDIVGSTHIVLSLALMDGKDAAIFAYLEETDDKSGNTNYITEGVLRVSHRTTPANNAEDEGTITRIGAFDKVPRSFLDKDMQPLTEQEFSKVDIVMEPVAYRVPAHSTLRLVLAGADSDNFYIDNIDNLATTWKVDPSQSRVIVPIKKTASD